MILLNLVAMQGTTNLRKAVYVLEEKKRRGEKDAIPLLMLPQCAITREDQDVQQVASSYHCLFKR